MIIVLLFGVLATLNALQNLSYSQLLETCDVEKVCKAMSNQLPISNSSVVNVHFTLHSHLDAFWLESYDQYVNGTGIDPIHAKVWVNSLFSGVLESLQKHPQATYMIAEMCFFKPWFEQISSDDQDIVRSLLKSGQLDIINGGWVQNDQACANYQDIILQMAVGHQYLNNKFGIRPTVSINADSFGHSATQMAINYLNGIQAQIIARLDTQDIQTRASNQSLEFMWNGGPSTINFLSPMQQPKLLTHIRFRRHGPYRFHSKSFGQSKTPGDGFCFSIFQSLKEFERLLSKQSQGGQQSFHYGGDDFQYFNSSLYDSQELLVEFYNVFQCRSIKIHWSTASRYFREKRNSQSHLQQKYGDFLPYWEDGLYWTSFYTTDPEFKLYARQVSINLFSIQQYVSQLFIQNDFDFKQQIIEAIEVLREEVALAQHHDGVTGTSKYWVHDDVVKRLGRALENCRKYVGYMNSVIYKSQYDITLTAQSYRSLNKKMQRSQLNFVECSLTSEAKRNCIIQFMDQRRIHNKYYNEPIQTELVVLVFNPTADHERVIELDLHDSQIYATIYTMDGVWLDQEVRCWENRNNCSLVFISLLRGYTEEQFLIKFNQDEDDSLLINSYVEITELDINQSNDINNTILIYNYENVKVQYIYNYIVKVYIKVEKEDEQYKHTIIVDNCTQEEQNYLCINSFVLAYMFYPNIQQQSWNYWTQKSFIGTAGKYVSMNDPTREEQICEFSMILRLERVSNISLPIFMKCRSAYLIKLTIFPRDLINGIDVETQMFQDGLKQELGDHTLRVQNKQYHQITHLGLNQNLKDQFFTDSNGWFMMFRKNNERENYQPIYNKSDSINGNIYPITSFAAMSDQDPIDGEFVGNTLIILTDRAQGVFTKSNRSLEIVIEHYGEDDGEGVGETCTKRVDNFYRHRIIFNKGKLCLRCQWYQWQIDGYLQNVRLSEVFLGDLGKQQQKYDPSVRIELWPLKESKYLLFVENLQEIVPSKSQTQFKNITNYDQSMNRNITSIIEDIKQSRPNTKIIIKQTYLNGVEMEENNEYGKMILRPSEINVFALEFIE